MVASKFHVSFRQEACKGCGLCKSVCPKKIIMMDKSKVNSKGYHPAYIEKMEECIGCLNCATICPDVVISIEKMESGKERE